MFAVYSLTPNLLLPHFDEFQDRRECLGLFFPAGDDLHLAGKFSQQIKINRRSTAAEGNFQTQKNSPPGRYHTDHAFGRVRHRSYLWFKTSELAAKSTKHMLVPIRILRIEHDEFVITKIFKTWLPALRKFALFRAGNPKLRTKQ